MFLEFFAFFEGTTRRPISEFCYIDYFHIRVGCVRVWSVRSEKVEYVSTLKPLLLSLVVVVAFVVVVVFVIVVVGFWFVIGRFFTNLSCHAVAAGRDS